MCRMSEIGRWSSVFDRSTDRETALSSSVSLEAKRLNLKSVDLTGLSLEIGLTLSGIGSIVAKLLAPAIRKAAFRSSF